MKKADWQCAVRWLLTGWALFSLVSGCAVGTKDDEEGEDRSTPAVSSISPADGAASISTTTTIKITFSKAIDPGSVTVDSDGSCSKNIQISADSFNTCLPLSSSWDNASKVTFTAATYNSKLLSNTAYSVKVATGVKDYYKTALASNFTSSFTTQSVCSSCSWDNVSSVGSLTGRTGHATAVFNQKMWVFGGYDGSDQLNDVLSSNNGSWASQTTTNVWSARQGHAAVTFNGKLWVLGGYAGSQHKQDVWYSTDGLTWSESTTSGIWSTRRDHAAVVFNGKIFILGGIKNNSKLNDVYSSSDGSTWTEVTSTASWSARYGHAAVVFDGKIWVMGGDNGSSVLNDVWHSSDGSTWTPAASASWSARYGHQAEVFDGKIWVLGGKDSDGNQKQDYYSSSYGTSWDNGTIGTTHWSQRNDFSSAVFDNKLWIIGGDKGSGTSRYLNDVWTYAPL